MGVQGDKLFALTEDMVKDIRYVRLNKRASYLEKELENVTYNKSNDNKSDIIQFYSLGFYDSLTCVRSKNLLSSAHKEHFLISYPYEKTANTSNVEQWFGLLPLSGTKRYQAGKHDAGDPFFCNAMQQKDLPFIGVILLSLGYGEKCEETSFINLLADFAEKCPAAFPKPADEDKYIAELYYSLNCADLCMAVRTDDLSFIHNLNRRLIDIADKCGYSINSTVIFAIQHQENDYKRWIEKNKKVTFVVRSYERYDESSLGVNGNGRYVTRLKYEDYIAFLPQLIAYKLDMSNEDKNSRLGRFARSICHEREWFDEGSFSGNDSNLGEEKQNLQPLICAWIKEIHDVIVEIEDAAYNIFLYDRGLYKCREMFMREIRLIKDLVYAYSDLWYQNTLEDGFVFFMQLMAALQGIKVMLDDIDKRNRSKNVMESSQEQFFDMMHMIACDLNGYNKQFQFLNQDSVNYPNYEIQSKVNAEKYMAAYSSFLHRFFVLYYGEKKAEQNVVQNIPLALVDLNQRKIVTNMFFLSLYGRNKKSVNNNVRGIFAVHFPSSEYFSDLWSTLPLLMHEVSHTHNYGEVVNRNRALVYHIDNFFAEKITDGILKVVNDGIMVPTSSFLLEVLKKIVYRVIYCQRETFFKEIGGFDGWNFLLLIDNCEKFYENIFNKNVDPKSVTYNQRIKLLDRMKEYVMHIMQKLDFPQMCYVFVKDKGEMPTKISYYINVLYLEFNHDFYLENKETYDNQFQDDLEREISDSEEGSAEREVLCLALYRFLKFVKRDEVTDDGIIQISDRLTDSLVIAFSLIQIEATRAIFEKYRHGFMENVSEKKYCKDLIPKIHIVSFSKYSDELEMAFSLYAKGEGKDVEKPSMHDCSLMNAMFSEYYETYLCINNIIRFLVNEQFSESCYQQIQANSFIECIHRECKKYVREEEEKRGFQTIFTPSNRKQLMRLGFFEEESSILKNVFAQFFSECTDDFVKKGISDGKAFFKEVYADCGMCCAMGFEPFGYCMFALSIYNVVSDSGDVDVRKKFLTDRIRAVLGMYFKMSEKESWTAALERFLHRLCDVDMIMAICRMFQRICPNEDIRKISQCITENRYKIEVAQMPDEVEIFQSDYKGKFSIWMDEIIGKMIGIIENVYEKETVDDLSLNDRVLTAKMYLSHVYSVLKLFKNEDILPHIPNDMFQGFFQGVESLMRNGKGIAVVRRDPCVREISRFYNMDCPQNVDKFEWYYNTYANGFITQCNFIFHHYCEYRSAYNQIRKESMIDAEGNVNLNINQWYDIIDSYYQEGV